MAMAIHHPVAIAAVIIAILTLIIAILTFTVNPICLHSKRLGQSRATVQ